MNKITKFFSIAIISSSFVTVSALATDLTTINVTGSTSASSANPGYYSSLKLTSGLKTCSGTLGDKGYTYPHETPYLKTGWTAVKTLCESFLGNKTCTADILVLPANDPGNVAKIEACQGTIAATVTMYLTDADGRSEGDIVVSNPNKQSGVSVSGTPYTLTIGNP